MGTIQQFEVAWSCFC